jgi:hypothetical protein
MQLVEKFEIHDTLNPNLWDKDNRLLPDVRDRLIEIAHQFLSSVEFEFPILDIRLVGSSASYNYTPNSDIDVHIITNFSYLDCNSEIVQLLFNALKSKFNTEYSITVKGLEVEIYVEDVVSGISSNGIYSIINDNWIKFPERIQIPNQLDTSIPLSQWKIRYEDVMQSNTTAETISNLIDDIYLMRKDSIAKEGEYGLGNQVFKDFRALGYLDNLKKAYKDVRSSELTLEKLSLREDTRNKLMSKSKQSQKGMQRFKRRVKSRVANSVKQYNSIDMNKLFKQDILTVDINVKGETNDYTVKISFGGFLQLLQDQIEKQEGKLDLKAVTRALVNGFNRDDVYIHCSCPDWKYRFNYFATRNQINSGEAENRPSDITNPNDALGSACKHVLLVLSNTSWIIKVGATIYNYINYMQKHYQKLYADIIYPAVYGKEYEEPVQLDIFDDNELATDTDTIDKSNKFAVDNSRFQKGNDKGIRFASKNSDQISIEDNEESDTETLDDEVDEQE